jgi:competence protein ComEC
VTRAAASGRVLGRAAATRLGKGFASARGHPWHVGIAAAVLGLAAGPRAPLVVLGVAAVLPLLAARASTRVALVVALLGAGLVGQARLQARDASALGPRVGHVVDVRVVLLETPRRRSFGARAAAVDLDGERVLVRAGRAVRWPTERVGAILGVRGLLEALGSREGDRRAQGVHAQLRAEAIDATGLARGGALGAVDRIRTRAVRALQSGVPPPQGALLRGMALGDDAALPDDVRDDFRRAGLSHLVAASGQNVMLLAALALAFAGAVGLGLRTRLILVLALIAAYVPLAGGGASIQRAGIMGAAGVVAMLAGRPASRWYAVLLAAGTTLLINPRAIEEVGWQLSFAAVVAILLLAPRLRDGLSRRGVPLGLAEATALTAAATIGTAPLVAAHFGQASLVSLPANMVAAPAVAPTMWLGMVAAAVGQIGPGLAAPITSLAGYPAAYLMWLAHAAGGAPGAGASATTAVVAAVCVALALAVVVPRARPLVAVACVAIVAVAVALARPGDGAASVPLGLRITFLDVGQGDATLVQHRSAAVLVDTGPPDGPILDRLRQAGVRRLDLLVITHAQADHEGAAPALLRTIPIRLVLDGRDGVREPLGARMAAEAKRRRVGLVAARAGEVVRIGPIVLRVLWPPPRGPQDPPGEDPNMRAIVAEADADGVRMLLTADAESDVLSGLDLRTVDLLKVSHHGSADPGLPAVLERLRPRLAAIEVGRHNLYGHPAASTLRALTAAGVPVVRTDRDGSVSVEPSATGLRIHAHA